MKPTLYERIKELCQVECISIAKLESELGFGNGSIKKWERLSSPSIDKIIKVSTYFDVSVDYLLCRTDIKGSITEVLGDEDVISFQRARQNMTPQDRERMMNMLKVGFDYAFSDKKGEE